MGKRKVQAYTEEFRKEAVRRSEKEGVTAKQVAEELGITVQQIYNWKRQYNKLIGRQFKTVDGVDYSKKESEELRALKRENKRLKDENAFLKKLLRTLRTTRSKVRRAKSLHRSISNNFNVPCSQSSPIWIL